MKKAITGGASVPFEKFPFKGFSKLSRQLGR
jgi:hypothetical protein